MARQRIAVQVNKFVGGFNTEANPLEFPPNASSDENNMILLPNGTRARRPGFDLETDNVEVDTSVQWQSDATMGRSAL